MSDQQHTVTFTPDMSSVTRQQQLGEATSQIQYVSQGHCLVIGHPEHALSSAAPLAASGFTVVHVDTTASQVSKRLTDDGVAVFTVPKLLLSGYLGAFRALVPATQDAHSVELDLGVSVYRESGLFDLVLDLSAQALMPMRLPPFGYLHATDDSSVDQAIHELLELRGEFDKPRYFNYNASICAHSRSELDGCHRCMDVCTTDAIRSDGEGISVDPFLCQGCGSCATVCPSGAMSYAYPRPADAILRTRHLLSSHHADTIVLHTEAHQAAIDAAQFDGSIMPLLVEEVSAFGADYWLSMLAGPASRVYIVIDTDEDDPNRRALTSQQAWLEPLLNALGLTHSPVQLISSKQLPQLLPTDALQRDHTNDHAEQIATIARLQQLNPQDFATHNDKRQTLRLALDALSDQLTPVPESTELPAGAPFGRINVDTNACTLCMACVSTCPAKALLDGQDTPALRFIEANCVQCGLCETACPESAITLQTRYTWDSIEARKVETLHEEQPFHCTRCHTVFSTQAMINTMTEKLSSHWMFQNESAVRRLKLCGDCRVRDMFEEDAAGISVHEKPR